MGGGAAAFCTLSTVTKRPPPLSIRFDDDPDQLSVQDYSAYQGVTKRCRLSWLTNSALVYEPKYEGRGGELRGLSQCEQLYTGAQINLGDLTPYLTYGAYDCSVVIAHPATKCINFECDTGVNTVNGGRWPLAKL